MKFGYTILYVDNVEATLSFYEKAFDMKRRFLAPEKNYGELESGETRLAFAAAEFVSTLIPIEFLRARSSSQPHALELGFVTDDVATAFQGAVAAGALPIKEPTQKPWGQIVGYVRDLNGFLVEICTPMP